MLEYAKVILPKVSFDKNLFRKELVKCLNWVEPAEIHELRDWCYENFKNQYPGILDEVFENIAA
jgi:hypothetical protein